MKKIIKTVQSSYLHLFNILLNQIKFLSWVIESSFLTQLECLNSTSQFNSTLFQKKFNSIQHFSSWVLDLNLSTWLDAISLLLIQQINEIIVKTQYSSVFEEIQRCMSLCKIMQRIYMINKWLQCFIIINDHEW